MTAVAQRVKSLGNRYVGQVLNVFSAHLPCDDCSIRVSQPCDLQLILPIAS